MHIHFSLLIAAFWAVGYAVAKRPGGINPLPVTCDSCCPPGVSCPEIDGCYIQGRQEAEGRCATSVKSAIAAEQTNCTASIASASLAQQTSCDIRIAEQQGSYAASVSSATAAAIASVSESFATSISAQEASCTARISAQQTGCAGSVSSAIGTYSGALNECRAALSQCKSPGGSTNAPSCGVEKWGQGYYSVKTGVTLAHCRIICNTDPKCLSFSANKGNVGAINCYLYDKETAAVPYSAYPNWVQYDKRCGTVVLNPPMCRAQMWGQGYYTIKAGVALAQCRAICLEDPNCLSYSANGGNVGAINCYLYDKETAAVPYSAYPNWVQYDKRCG